MNVKFQHPGLPDGYKISITGLNAVLLNNEDVEVSEEAIAQYEAVTGKKFSETLKSPSFTGIRPEPKQDAHIEEDNNNNNNNTDMPPDNDGVEA